MKTKAKLICSTILAFSILSCTKEKSINKVPIADAGDPQSIELPVDSVRLSGSGEDKDGQVVAYLWSKVSGPKQALIVNQGSASTLVRGLVPGTYSFQLMVVDDKGATGVDTVSVNVAPTRINTLVLKPANNPTEVHVWGNSFKDGSHHGAPELGASSWTHDGDLVGQRGLFKFDFSSIPSTATIVSAKLSLFSNPTPSNGDLQHANSGDANTMLIQRVTSAWSAPAVRWTNQPNTTTSGQIVIPHTNQQFLDLLDVDVKNLVQTMVSDNANHGFMIKLQNENPFNSRIFSSSFYSNSSKHPKIVIEYTN